MVDHEISFAGLIDKLESLVISPNCKRSAIFQVNSNKRKNRRNKPKAIPGMYEIFAVLPDKRSQRFMISFGDQNFSPIRNKKSFKTPYISILRNIFIKTSVFCPLSQHLIYHFD